MVREVRTNERSNRVRELRRKLMAKERDEQQTLREERPRLNDGKTQHVYLTEVDEDTCRLHQTAGRTLQLEVQLI